MQNVWHVVGKVALLGWILMAGLNLAVWFHVVVEHSAMEERHAHEAASAGDRDGAKPHESNHHETDHREDAPNHSHELNLDVTVATRVSGTLPPQLLVADLAKLAWRPTAELGRVIHLPPPRPPTTPGLDRHPILLI